MENASKALIIAGAILISILIIALGVFIYRKVSTQVDTSSDLSEYEIQAINSKFERFLGAGKSYNDVKSLLETAQNYNNSVDGSKYVSVGLYNPALTGRTTKTYTLRNGSYTNPVNNIHDVIEWLEPAKTKKFEITKSSSTTDEMQFYKNGLINYIVVKVGN